MGAKMMYVIPQQGGCYSMSLEGNEDTGSYGSFDVNEIQTMAWDCHPASVSDSMFVAPSNCQDLSSMMNAYAGAYGGSYPGA